MLWLKGLSLLGLAFLRPCSQFNAMDPAALAHFGLWGTGAGLAGLGAYRGARSLYRALRGYGQKRKYSARTGISRSLRSFDLKPHRVRQTMIMPLDFYEGPTATGGNGYKTLTSTSSNTSNPGLYFTFYPQGFNCYNGNSGANSSQSPDSNLAGIFREVRLDYVVVKCFMSANDAYNVGTTYSATMPTFTYALDFNQGSGNVPTSFGTVGDYANSRTVSGNAQNKDGSVFTVKFRPRISDSAGGVTNIAPKWGQWLSTTNSGASANHQGMMLYVNDPLLTSATTKIAATHTFVVTLYTSWRGFK